jgi:uncharacterized protein (DUF2147 family)
MPIALLLSLAAQAAAQPSVQGTWRSPGGNSIITIAPCGPNLCGTVTWASEKAQQDARKTTPQLVGTQLITDLQDRGGGRWLGSLFVPDKNMRVTAKIELASPDKLKVSGCLAGKALCKSELWTRTNAVPAAN